MDLTYSIADQSFARTRSIGILNVSLHLMQEMAERREVGRMTVLANSSLMSNLGLPEKVRVAVHDIPLRGALGRFVWDQWSLFRVPLSPNEWLFLPKGYSPVLGRPPCRLAVYVHDTMVEHYRERYPSAMPRGWYTYYRLCLSSSLRYADVVFTNSEFSASEIRRVCRRWNLVEPLIVVAGIGFDRELEGVTGSAERNGVLVLASTAPHKKTRRAVEYMAEWQRKSTFSETVHWLGASPVGLDRFPNWRHALRMPEAEYRSLLQQIRALVFFTDHEGFGMPPIEAVLAGAAPVYSSIPATTEAMAGHGFAFENDSVSAFEVAMDEALACGQEELAVWRAMLLQRHSWRQVGQRVIDGLAQAARQGA